MAGVLSLAAAWAVGATWKFVWISTNPLFALDPICLFASAKDIFGVGDRFTVPLLLRRRLGPSWRASSSTSHGRGSSDTACFLRGKTSGRWLVEAPRADTSTSPVAAFSVLSSRLVPRLGPHGAAVAMAFSVLSRETCVSRIEPAPLAPMEWPVLPNLPQSEVTVAAGLIAADAAKGGAMAASLSLAG